MDLEQISRDFSNIWPKFHENKPKSGKIRAKLKALASFRIIRISTKYG